MRTTIVILSSLCIVAAAPGWARGTGAFRLAERAIVAHRLLTPAELACSTLVRGSKAVREAAEIIVLERHGGRCPGNPGEPPRPRFSLFVDAVSGSIQWNYPDPTIYEDLPAPGEAPTVPSILTACGVCAHI
jgi:hypothetical protein